MVAVVVCRGLGSDFAEPMRIPAEKQPIVVSVAITKLAWVLFMVYPWLVLTEEVETRERITQIQSVQPTKEVNQPCFFPVRDGEPNVFIFFDLEQETKTSVGVGANKVERNQTVC